MASEIRDPTGDIGKGADITAIGTQWHITARYFLPDGAEVDTGTTAEAEVREGAMVQTPTTPPPHQYGQKTWGGG